MKIAPRWLRSKGERSGYAFHTARREISLDSRAICARSGNLSAFLPKPRPRTQESRQIRCAIRGLRFRLAGSLLNARGHCGEGGNARKFPLASKGGNDIFATIVFQPIRVWGVGPAALEVKRGNAAWGRKNRHL